MSELSKSKTPLSIKDLAAMNEHAELVDNHLIIKNYTSYEHNNAVLEIAMNFKSFISKTNGDCKVSTDVVALHCDELCDEKGNFFLPDVMVVCDKDGIKHDGVHTAPRFVAEVTSESTKSNDYGQKMVIYSKIGVEEYWVVDLQRKLIVRYLLRNGFIPEMIHYPNTVSLSVDSYPGLTIELSPIFEA